MTSMLLQMNSQSLIPLNFHKSPMPMKMLPASRALFSIRVRSSTTSPPSPTLMSEQPAPNSPPPSLVTTARPTLAAGNLGFRPTPELGLLSHLFVFSMAFGAFFSVAMLSIPTLIAFGRLGASVNKLSKVVSEEVPGTLSSLKLSTMELNDLTQQLSSLRQKISGVGIGKKDGSTTRSRSFRNKNPSS